MIKFVTLCGTITRQTAPVVPASIATATQVELDVGKILLNNWERGKRDQSDYIPIKDERTFVPWLKEMMNIVGMQGYTRLFDPSFLITSIRPGDDQQLCNKQKAYTIFVLTKLLETTQGLRFLSIHKGDPRQQLMSYQSHVLRFTNAGIPLSLSKCKICIPILSPSTKIFKFPFSISYPKILRHWSHSVTC